MDSLVVENNGVEIKFKEGLGRIVVATKNFNTLSNIVIRERPAIIWDTGESEHSSFRNFLDAYTDASSDVKTNILTMHYPPLDGDSSIVTRLRPAAQMLAVSSCNSSSSGGSSSSSSRHHQYDAPFILKLLAIIATNAHQYYGYQQQSSDDNDENLHKYEETHQTKCEKTALYLFASKVQHSCDPNVSYTSKTHDGALEYKVIKPIQAGDEISFSYITDLYHTPTFQRRRKLQAEKDFVCMCNRCIGPDFCRVAQCSQCGELLPTQTQTQAQGDDLSLKSNIWQCVKGCTPTMDNDCFERRYEEKKILIESSLRAETSTDGLYQLIKGVSKNLSPTHYIAIQGWLYLSTLYASKAAEKDKMIQMSKNLPASYLEYTSRISDLSVKELRQKAALTGLWAVSLIECVANKCLGCKPGNGMLKHNPNYESSARVFHACIDLMDISVSMYPSGAKLMVTRYLPVLYATFGNNDDDVHKIKRVILSNTDTTDIILHKCEGCSKVQEKLFSCSQCNLVSYCGKDCQTKHWKAVHKKQCVQCPKGQN
jgi:hypothetical protein